MLRALALAIVALCLAGAFLIGASVANAGPRVQTVITCDERGCSDSRTASPSYRAGGVRVASGMGAGRPLGCPSRWCGCWARLDAGVSDTRYDQALKWLEFRHIAGRGAFPVVGSYAVTQRAGGGHVGRVVAVEGGNPVIRSGNYGHRVGEAVVPRARVLAYVQP